MIYLYNHHFCRLDANSYFLKLHRTESFPTIAPEVITNLGSAFQHLWQTGDTLCSLYHHFVERCLRYNDVDVIDSSELRSVFLT